MIQLRKTLLIVSLDRKVNNFLRTIIHNIIGSKINVDSRIFEDSSMRQVQPDVVLTSGPFLLARLRALYPDIPIIAPKRLITGYNLEKALMLPRGTRVLVVNHPRSASEDTIECLRSLGITHLEYVPYWKGAQKDLSRCDTAISPGMSHLCPREIKNVIDIGPRIISIHSFLDLLLALDLDLGYLESYATYTQNFLMESSRKLASVLEHSELLRRYQEIILNQFEDGLLSVNEAGEVEIANRAAARLFGRENVDLLLSAGIADLMAGFKHTATLKDESPTDSRSTSIYENDGKQILVQKIPVLSEKSARRIYTFREIARIQRLEKDVRVRLAEKGHVTKYGFEDIWSESRIILDLKDKATHFATTEKNILITGESGTGKELFAHAIHRGSPRREGPFVAVNFAGIPDTLIESELFGYEAGAFTGARKGGKTGLFEQAHGGTIFLDEIGDAPMNLQARLLRVLQEREIMKIGGSRITPIDVRIIAGTNCDLHEAMQEKKFRRDLYYRLNTLPLELPPLREHKEDVFYILRRYLSERYGMRKEFADEVRECLLRYDWPGNQRELINLAEYICISTRGAGTVRLEHLPRGLVEAPSARAEDGMHDGREAMLGEILHRSSITADVVRSLLLILRDRRGVPTGRKSMIRELAARDHVLSEGRMKRLLHTLKAMELIQVGATKQGSTLSPKGEAFLEAMLSASM